MPKLIKSYDIVSVKPYAPGDEDGFEVHRGRHLVKEPGWRHGVIYEPFNYPDIPYIKGQTYKWGLEVSERTLILDNQWSGAPYIVTFANGFRTVIGEKELQEITNNA